MAVLVCDLCGGKLTMGAGGVAACESCGMEYSAERMREKVREMNDGDVGDNRHSFENFLEMANRAYQSSNNEETESYCNKVLEIDPRNYQALMLKGKAAGWQSTLQNSRLAEAVNCFSSAIENAPEEERDDLISEAKEQISDLSLALVGLQSDRFEKWPDEEEQCGLIQVITEVYKILILFATNTGESIDKNIMMKPIATRINNSVMGSWNRKIVPEYRNDCDGHPDDDAFRQLIARGDICINLLEKAIGLSDADDNEDLIRYQNIIDIHEFLINGCSYEYRTVTIEGTFWNDYQNTYENRYCVNLSLTDSAKATRRNLISQCRSKINGIKEAAARKLAAEKAEKERIEREEAQKRFNAYWEEHAEEKEALKAEQETIKSQMGDICKEKDAQINKIKKEIENVPGKVEIGRLNESIQKLTDEKNALGLFKGKEKKALQSQIDQLLSDRAGVESRMKSERKKLEAKISEVENAAQTKITALQRRDREITNELTRGR